MSDDSEAISGASRRSSVLVATSDSATRNLLRQILHVGAVDLVDAVDGVEALAMARRLDLDLIVLDAFLAVMDGIAVCGRIRTLKEIDQPPILMVGLISERAVELAFSVGADETLAKPLSPNLIRTRTRALLTRRREEKRLRLKARVLEAAPVGITLLDARSSEYSVVHANRAFLQMTEHSSEEIVGRNLRMLTGPGTDVTTMTSLRDDLAAGRPSRALLKNYRKNGEAFWNDLTLAPLVDELGRLTHYIAVEQDVTRHVEASRDEAARAVEETVLARTRDIEASLVRVENRRRFAETILNGLVSALLTTDQDGYVTFANLAALRTLGTSMADCVGRSVVEIFGHNEGVAEIVEGSVPVHREHRLDFPLNTPGGARIYVGISIMRPPPELRDEIRLIFLFRNVAETFLDESDPRLTDPDEVSPGPREPPDREPPSSASETPPPMPPAGDAPAGPGATADDPQEVRRRILLSLRYTRPADVMQEVIDELAAERGTGGPVVRLEADDDVPEVLLDRQQTRQAFRLLLQRTVDRCEDRGGVRVRVFRTQAEQGRTGRPVPAGCIQIIYPRTPIPDGDPGPDEEDRPAFRRADLADAEKLIEANGGLLKRPRRDAEEGVLEVLFLSAD